jgi:hypothetical protein
MGNLAEELQPSRVVNSNGLKYNNQDYLRHPLTPKISKKDLAIFHQNIRGLNSNKLDELSISLSVDFSHIICLTEHHICSNDIDTILLTNNNLGAKFCRI